MSYKKDNKTSNPWYDNDYKSAKKAIRDAPNKSMKLEKISVYKTHIKRKKGPILIRGKSIFFTFLKLGLEIFGGMFSFIKLKKII